MQRGPTSGVPISQAELGIDSIPRDEGPGAELRAFAASAMVVALALVCVWSGAMKFTSYEAQSIAPFVMNSPLMSWMYPVFGIQGSAVAIGIYEIVTGLLLLARWVAPSWSAVGAALASLMFVVTLSFMLTTPGVTAVEAGGFPALSAEIGQFLAKDVVLLAASLYILGDSLAAHRRRRYAR
jgi:uncharacterized membrane protein YkgB